MLLFQHHHLCQQVSYDHVALNSVLTLLYDIMQSDLEAKQITDA